MRRRGLLPVSRGLGQTGRLPLAALRRVLYPFSVVVAPVVAAVGRLAGRDARGGRPAVSGRRCRRTGRRAILLCPGSLSAARRARLGPLGPGAPDRVVGRSAPDLRWRRGSG